MKEKGKEPRDFKPLTMLAAGLTLGIIGILGALARANSSKPYGVLAPNDLWLVTLIGCIFISRPLILCATGYRVYGKVFFGLLVMTIFGILALITGHLTFDYDFTAIALAGGLYTVYQASELK
ncbi:MAG TPA: hypothetical protein VEA59_02675 [Patescibacteria group bacterium]|nr:hypothetical protein [Patescibacteria group bacterium]